MVEEFDLSSDTSDQDFGRQLRIYSEFLCSARDYGGGLTFLHYIFALDSFLGGNANQNLSQVLAERICVLCHSSVEAEYKLSYSELRKLILGMYDWRSKYVHRGQRSVIEPRHFDILELCTQVVMCAALKVRGKKWANDKALPRWLSRVDQIATKLSNDEAISDVDYLSVGVSVVTRNRGVVGVSVKEAMAKSLDGWNAKWYM